MAKALLVLTIDYEVFGNGSGSVDTCVIKPAERLMKLCEEFDTRLTFFVDVAELWAFKAVEAASGFEDANYRPGTWIEEQLRAAVSRKHDVQLHLHPQWLTYQYRGRGAWRLDYAQYRTSSLSPDGPLGLDQTLRRGKSTLEELLAPVDSGYSCNAFRAGGLCIQPEEKVLRALVQAGIRKDSSVMPNMLAPGKFGFDFSDFGPSPKRPYKVADSLRAAVADGEISEIPICTARSMPWSNLTFSVLRRFRAPADRPVGCVGAPVPHHRDPESKRNRFLRHAKRLLPRFRPLEITGPLLAEEMIYVLKKGLRGINGLVGDDLIPLVAIGHCKNFGTERELIRFLEFAREHPDVQLEGREGPSIWR